jgi:hypothetical protein
VDTDRKAALEALLPLHDSPIADAYLAYLLQLSDQDVESNEALKRVRRSLPAPLCKLSRLDPEPRVQDNPIRVCLRTIRLVLEEYHHESDPLPLACSVFRTHPLDSTVAFGVMWGTLRDELGQRMKRHCTEQLLRQVSSRSTLRILAIEGVLCDALQRVAPIPQEPMYRSIYLAACDLLQDVILAPELTLLNDEAPSTASIESIIRDYPERLPRIREFETLLAKEAPDLGKGICAIRSSRNQEESLEHCVRRAKQSAHEALASWLSSVQNSPPPSSLSDAAVSNAR